MSITLWNEHILIRPNRILDTLLKAIITHFNNKTCLFAYLYLLYLYTLRLISMLPLNYWKKKENNEKLLLKLLELSKRNGNLTQSNVYRGFRSITNNSGLHTAVWIGVTNPLLIEKTKRASEKLKIVCWFLLTYEVQQMQFKFT